CIRARLPAAPQFSVDAAPQSPMCFVSGRDFQSRRNRRQKKEVGLQPLCASSLRGSLRNFTSLDPIAASNQQARFSGRKSQPSSLRLLSSMQRPPPQSSFISVTPASQTAFPSDLAAP